MLFHIGSKVLGRGWREKECLDRRGEKQPCTRCQLPSRLGETFACFNGPVFLAPREWARTTDLAVNSRARAYRPVTVRDGDRTVRIPAIQAVLRSQIALAAKGNGPAQRSVVRGVQKIEREHFELLTALTKTAIEYQYNARDLQHRAKQGITDIDPLAPHPDDVHIDMNTGEVAFRHRDFGEGE